MIGKTTSIKYYWNCNNFWVRNINISPRVTFLYLTLKKWWYLWWRYSSGCTVKNYKHHWWVSCQVQRNSKFCLRENFIKYSMWGTRIFKGLHDIRFHRSQSERHIVANLERHWINQFTLKGIQYSSHTIFAPKFLHFRLARQESMKYCSFNFCFLEQYKTIKGMKRCEHFLRFLH